MTTFSEVLKLIKDYSRTQRALAKAAGRSNAWIRHQGEPKGHTRPLKDQPAAPLSRKHDAIVFNRPRFPDMVREPTDADTVLKSGQWNEKIGAEIFVGDWTGSPLLDLTLPERTTCPITCRHWLDCMGNSMPWPIRWQPGPALWRKLRMEVADLAKQHPNGFAIRLHILGDFADLDEVALWRELLEQYPNLRIFGMSARHFVDTDPIAAELVEMARQSLALGKEGRFRMMFSDAPASLGVKTTMSVQMAAEGLARGATPCPEQRALVKNCGACGICLSPYSTKPISFEDH
jgi:hypothetical protein